MAVKKSGAPGQAATPTPDGGPAANLKPWPLLKDEEVLKTPVFNLKRQTCLSPKDGREKVFTVLDVPDWVQVLPITADGQAVLVSQYRLGSREISLELPGGVVERGQTPLEAGQRELREETGYQAGRWRKLAAFRPNPAVQNNTAHFFVAEDAFPAGPTDFDENEDIELVLAPLADLKKMINDGRIDHAIMVAAILSYFNRYEVNS